MDWVPNFTTDSLLALDACRPLGAQLHAGEWASITTPLRLREWERGLSSHPDREFVQYVCNGIRDGFRIGFRYRTARCKGSSSNMGSAQSHKEVVEQYIAAECEARRLLDPLDRSKFPQVHVSPFGVIPKSEPGKWHLIMDLSSPSGSSVNDGIEKQVCSLSYTSVDNIADRVMCKGKGALLAKFNLKEVYRQVAIHPDDRWMLGMEWRGHLFIDTALPFGLWSTPMIFNALAEALAFMIRQKRGEGSGPLPR